MPSPSPANQKLALRCLRCKHPLRISLDKLTKLLKCAHCGCHFRVTKAQGAGYVAREEGAAARPAAPASGAAPPPYVATIRQERPPTAPHLPGSAPPNTDADRTMKGKSVAPLPDWLAENAPHVRGFAAMGKPSERPGPHPGEPGAADADADRTVMGKPIAPPVNGRPRPPAPHRPVSGKAAAPNPPRVLAGDRRPPAPKGTAPPGPMPVRGDSGGGWKWVVALLGVLVLIAGGTAAAFYWLPLGKPAPVSLGKYGGVEIGSTGVKMVGVEYVKTDEGVTETLLAEPTDANPKLADLPEGASDFDDRALQKTVDQVNDYLVALGTLGVPADNQYVAYSSGVRAPFKADEDWKRNQDKLVNALRGKTGKDAAYVDAHDEAKFSFQELVPPAEWTESVLIDIGGNNIKGGGYARKNLFLDFSVNAGVSMFEKKVTKARDKAKETFAEAAGRLRKTEVEAPLQKDLAESSQLKSRPKVYLLGGLPWALATYTRPLEFYAPAPPKGVGREAFLRKLQPEDIGKFDDMVRTKKPAEIKSDIKVLVAGNKDVETVANENVDKIQTEVFVKSDRLIGGAQILRALDQEFALTDPKKEVRGFRYGQVAWLLGYVRSKSGHTD